jgi:hypothetical protein
MGGVRRKIREGLPAAQIGLSGNQSVDGTIDVLYKSAQTTVAEGKKRKEER